MSTHTLVNRLPVEAREAHRVTAPTSVLDVELDWRVFCVKGQVLNILGFPGHLVSLTTIQYCHYNFKAFMNNMKMNKYRLYSNKTLLLDTEI
jgi:hypothetical protein